MKFTKTHAFRGSAIALALVCAAPASAQTGGTSPEPKRSEPAPSTRESESVTPPKSESTPRTHTRSAPTDRKASSAPDPNLLRYGRSAPVIATVSCQQACAGPLSVNPGSQIRLTGKRLGAVDEVIFLGDVSDASDDSSVAPRAVRDSALSARVPLSAANGPVAVVKRNGSRSAPTSQPVVIAAADRSLAAGQVDSEVQNRRVFFSSSRPAEFSYRVGGNASATIKVELVQAASQTVVASWQEQSVAAGETKSVTWDGRIDGKLAPEGDYTFRIAADGAVPAAATAPDNPNTFSFLHYQYPVAGPVDYGEMGASFGGGRGHQGQDMLTKCGTPIVAARGGKVKFKKFQGAAGNYVVIDGTSSKYEFAYMHLREAALVDQGDTVRTGQLLGYAGNTGRTSGACMLHFELWTGKWQMGGSPRDPLPLLKLWDQRS